MKAFITGSYAYGTPHENSDVDLVILVSEQDSEILVDHFHADDSSGCEGDIGLRAGNLNIIALTDKRLYAAWQEGTDHLKSIKPVSRSKAIEVLETYRRKHLLSHPIPKRKS